VSGVQLGLAPGPIERVPADVAVVCFFEDERPLRGGAAHADWRLCGTLSRLIQRGKLSGAFGEAALVPATGGLRARWVLALGLGAREELDEARRRALARDCVGRAIDLQAGVVALPLPPAGPDDPGLEERLELLLAVLAEMGPELRRSVRIRLVAAAEEQPALLERVRRLAASPAIPGLLIDPPASNERPGRRLPVGSTRPPGTADRQRIK
jgi:hypothetical protein